MRSHPAGASDAEASYRRMHRTTVISTLVTVIPVGMLLVAVRAEQWWEAAVVSGGLLIAAGVMTQWGRTGYPRFGVSGLIVCFAVWAAGAFVMGNPTAFFPLVMVAAMVIPRLPRHRAAGTVGFSLVVGAVGALAVWTKPEVSFVEFSVMPTGAALFIIAVMTYNDRYWVIFQELERARKAEAELGIMRERVRFASELHDIQGHTLHVVKLKVALAEKLISSDPDCATEELREVHELVGSTITETRELAYAQRRLNLTSELENAKNLFEAGGIEVEIQRESQGQEEASPHNELLGQVLREATTNILRHAQATRVRIRLSEEWIRIANDGADSQGEGMPQLRGLETLRQRVNDSGGRLRAESAQGRFLTEASFGPDEGSAR